MTTKTIDLKDAAAYFGVEWITTFRSAALRGLLSTAMRGVQTIQTEIIPNIPQAPIDKGTYLQSWRFGPTDDGAEIWNDSPEAIFIEEGVRSMNVKPGRAMIDALAAWVVRKGLADADEARSVAFAISQVMKRAGIFNRNSNGLGILKRFTDQYADQLAKEEIEREVRSELE